MTEELQHPDNELFDHFNGALGPERGRAVEDHLAACSDCASVAAVVRRLKEQAEQSRLADRESRDQARKEPDVDAHPDVGTLASFFYRKEDDANNQATAAHVAVCCDCSDMLAEYARADRIASLYSPSEATCAPMGETDWTLIDEWENSSFGRLKPESEAPDRKLLDKLLNLLKDRGTHIYEAAHHALKNAPPSAGSEELVPVILVNRDAEFRGVEVFEKTLNRPGVETLKHPRGSRRFDNNLLHALFDFRTGDQILLSNSVKLGAARIDYSNFGNVRPSAANYFIMAD